VCTVCLLFCFIVICGVCVFVASVYCVFVSTAEMRNTLHYLSQKVTHFKSNQIYFPTQNMKEKKTDEKPEVTEMRFGLL